MFSQELKMDRTAHGNPTKNGEGLLKTTTWGTLIALSLLAAAFGFRSSFSSSPDGSAALQAEARQESAPLQSTQSVAEPSQEGRSLGKESGLSSASSNQDRRNGFSSANLQMPAAASTAPSNLAAKQDAQVPSLSSPASNNNQDPQSLIAAKIAPDLKGIDPHKPVNVIIQYRQSPSSELASEGLTAKAELPLIRAQLVTASAASLASLATHANVAYISPDRPVKGATNQDVSAVNADLAQASGWDGSGIGVAVVDSGINGVDDLNSGTWNSPSRIVYSQSFVSGDNSSSDAYGHGTHVAGIIAGNGYASNYYNYPGVYGGVAPNAKVINLRALDANGNGTDSTVINAIQKAISLKSTYNIGVLNLSLGRAVYETYSQDPLCQAVESAWQAGIVVVVSAGNQGENDWPNTDGYATINAPGNDPYVITVGASNTHGTGSQSAQTVTSYSSKGPTAIDHFVKPDLVAPGNNVVSTEAPGATLASAYPGLLVYPCNGGLNNCSSQFGRSQYMRLSGSSMAAAVVSGVSALMLEQSPSLTPDQVKARLMKTAWKNFPSYTLATNLLSGVSFNVEADIFAVGAGSVDASAALANTDL